MKLISRGSPDVFRDLRRDKITSDFSFEPLANFDTSSHYWTISLALEGMAKSLDSNRQQKNDGRRDIGWWWERRRDEGLLDSILYCLAQAFWYGQSYAWCQDWSRVATQESAKDQANKAASIFQTPTLTIWLKIPKIATDYMLHIISIGYILQRLTMTVRLTQATRFANFAPPLRKLLAPCFLLYLGLKRQSPTTRCWFCT